MSAPKSIFLLALLTLIGWIGMVGAVAVLVPILVPSF
jgi:hypothetical protein